MYGAGERCERYRCSPSRHLLAKHLPSIQHRQYGVQEHWKAKVRCSAYIVGDIAAQGDRRTLGKQEVEGDVDEGVRGHSIL